MKNCKNCNYFKTVYRRFGYYLSYSLTYPLYYCTLCERMTVPKNRCGSWQYRKKCEYDISPKRFAQAEEDIKALIALLGE